MAVLALETGQPLASVALVEGGRIVAEKELSLSLAQGRLLIPALRELRAAHPGLPVTLLAAGAGPGSYTGLRLGLACARACAYLLGVPAVGIPLFAALAEALPGGPEPALAFLLEARRDLVYAGLFAGGPEGYRLAGPARLLPPAAVADFAPRPAAVFGDGAWRYRDVLEAAGLRLWPADRRYPLAGRVGLIAEREAARGNFSPPAPLYLGPAPGAADPPG